MGDKNEIEITKEQEKKAIDETRARKEPGGDGMRAERLKKESETVLNDDLCSGVIYKYKCDRCNASYIGESERHYRARLSEHFGRSPRTGSYMAKPPHSAIRDHSLSENHPISKLYRQPSTITYVSQRRAENAADVKDLEIALDKKEKEEAPDERLLNELESRKVEILAKNNELQRMKETCIEKERKQNEEIEELRRKNREDNIMLNELREENKKLRQKLHEVKTEMESLRAESKSHQNLKPEETLSYKRLKLECAQKDQKINDQKEILENLRVEKEEKSKEVEILNNHLQKKNEETNHGNTDEPLLVEGLFAYMNDKVDDAKNLFEKLLSSSAAFDNPDHLEIILNCCEAIEKGLKGRNVHLLRGEHLSEHGLYDAAREDFELVLSLKNSEDSLQKVNEVKKKVQMWEDFNHYQVLGVEQNAKKSEILKAHKNLAMKYHPDRHRNKPQFLLDAFENKYKRICMLKLFLPMNKIDINMIKSFNDIA
ncbi:dnaJ homolog subfamily C member 3-like [Palaemon carinicauda]|uniref:dnaJ homolog subfamily C member 3-like n=1 Tax=Palaemon carinicauda TaxID=392227 RepID=UPI0035B60840